MFERLAHLVVRRRRSTLVLFVVGLMVAGVLGGGVFSRLQASGFDDPGSESAAAATYLRDTFGVADPVAVLAVETRDGLDAQAAQATRLVSAVEAEPGVTDVVSYWTSRKPAPLAGTDGRTGQVLVFADAGATYDQRTDLAKRILDGYGGSRDGLVVHVGGAPIINTAIGDTITKDLGRAESIAIPLTV